MKKLGWTLYLTEVMKVYQLPEEQCLLDTLYILHALELTNRVEKCHELI